MSTETNIVVQARTRKKIAQNRKRQIRKRKMNRKNPLRTMMLRS